MLLLLVTVGLCIMSYVECYVQFEYDLFNSFLKDLSVNIEELSSKALTQSLAYQKCKDEIFASFSTNENEFYTIIKNSGKEEFDLGNENECLGNGLSYFLIVYQKEQNEYISPSFKFLSKNLYCYGLCIKNECADFVEQFFDDKTNEDFHNVILHKENITNMYAIRISKKNGKVNHTNNEGNTHIMFNIFFILFVFVMFIRVLLFIVSFCFTGKINLKQLLHLTYDNTISNDAIQLENKTIPTQKADQSIEYAFIEGMNNDKTNTSNNFVELNENKQNNNNNPVSIKSNQQYKKKQQQQKQFKQSICSRSFLYNILSLGSSFKMIFTEKNYIYNDNNLKIINFFKVMSLFWLTYNHNIWALITIPGRDVNSDVFFKNILLSLVKYSSFNIEIWITLEGFYLGFKLMSYIKKHNNSTSFKTFLLFYLNSIPKVIEFIFIFYMGHFYIKNYKDFITLNTNSLYEYFERNIIYCRECVISPSILFYLKLPYLDYFDQKEGFLKCFKFTYIFLNEHLCFVITLIIFYILFKFKNKKLDYIFLISLILNVIFSFCSIQPKVGTLYNFVNFLGETASLKYTHLYSNTYLIGVLMGVGYFYYKDSLSDNPLLANNKQYQPLSMINNVMMIIDHFSNKVKMIIVIVSIAIQIMLSLSYYLIKTYFVDTVNNDGINIIINKHIDMFTIYEKKIFLLAFVLLLLSVITYSGDILFTHFYSADIFGSLSRVGCCYLCIMDSLVYLFYCFYHVDLYFNYQNLFYSTFGLIIFVGFVSILITIMVELPMRMIVKAIKT
jgi:hypothetical protein